jgi:CBS domain-containing protein
MIDINFIFFSHQSLCQQKNTSILIKLASAMMPSNYLHQKVEEIAENDFVTLPEDALVAEAAKIMRAKDVSSIIITRKGSDKEPVGIITERDIIHRVMAENKGPFKVTVGRIMSSPIITIDAGLSVKEAGTLMRSKRIRRLPVLDKIGQIAGIITLKSVVGNMPSHNIDLVEVESSRTVIERGAICPYCQLTIKGSRNQMSDHIEAIHTG